MQTGRVIEQPKLVTEIHLGVQEIYYRGGIKFMSSCIIEVLNTAISRFSQLGVCISQVYETKQGSQVIYISAPLEKKPTIEKYTTFLADLSSAGEKWNIIEKESHKIFKRIEGPMARL